MKSLLKLFRFCQCSGDINFYELTLINMKNTKEMVMYISMQIKLQISKFLDEKSSQFKDNLRDVNCFRIITHEDR